MPKMEKKMVNGLVQSISGYELEGTVASAIALLTEVAEEHGSDAMLDYDMIGYDDDYKLHVYIKRLETDWEFEQRKAEHIRGEAWDRKQYERLRVKFEGS